MTPEPKPETIDERIAAKAIGAVGKKYIFVSHAHADRRLAAALKSLIDQAYSGIVEVFFSSDPTPGGGIQPGDDWYQRIHSQLIGAEAVWVLATKTSISRSWIYWEAGLGRAYCPGSIVVLRVGLSANDLHSPLNHFQSYDGEAIGDGGIGELLVKVGAQIGMTIPSVLVNAAVSEWTTSLQGYEPDSGSDASSSVISPEQVSQLDSLIARLESVVDSASLGRTVFAAPPVTLSTLPPPAGLASGREKVIRGIERRRIDDESRQARNEFLSTVLGGTSQFYLDTNEFFSKLSRVSDSISIEFVGIDNDGDARFRVGNGETTVDLWLDAECLLDFEQPNVAGRAASLAHLLKDAVS